MWTPSGSPGHVLRSVATVPRRAGHRDHAAVATFCATPVPRGVDDRPASLGQGLQNLLDFLAAMSGPLPHCEPLRSPVPSRGLATAIGPYRSSTCARDDARRNGEVLLSGDGRRARLRHALRHQSVGTAHGCAAVGGRPAGPRLIPPGPARDVAGTAPACCWHPCRRAVHRRVRFAIRCHRPSARRRPRRAERRCHVHCR